MKSADQLPDPVRTRCPNGRRVRMGVTVIGMAATALFQMAASSAHAQPDQIATTSAIKSAQPPNLATPLIPSAPRSTSLSPLAPVVVQPRPTGYFVGDLVIQRILLEAGDQPYTPIAFPPPGRVNSWLERRHATIATDASSRRWLVIEYQFLNAPKAVTAATLPAWQLTVKTSTATSPIPLKIPAASLNIAPLSPPGSPEQVGTRDLRPDRLPPSIATAPILRALAISTGGFALTLAAWLAWVLWRNKRAGATQPFAHALRELRTLADGEPRAWQILHRAFDRAAGRVVQSTTLPMLFERAPQLVLARAQIEEFFAQSNQLFFANGNATHAGSAVPRANFSDTSCGGGLRVDLSATLHPLTLCLALRRIEKRHER